MSDRSKARVGDAQMGTARSLEWGGGGGGGGSSVLCSQLPSLLLFIIMLDSKIIQIVVHRLSNWEMLYANDLMIM